jgi:hypothetical protein
MFNRCSKPWKLRPKQEAPVQKKIITAFDKNLSFHYLRFTGNERAHVLSKTDARSFPAGGRQFAFAS